jgi:hypothetical protein
MTDADFRRDLKLVARQNKRIVTEIGSLREDLGVFRVVLLNARVPRETAARLAAADAEHDVKATLIALLEPLGKLWRWQQQLEDAARKHLEFR